MMKRSIVMTSDPFAMPVRGKGDRTAPIGPENRDTVSRQPLEDLGGGVPVVVVPTDADHGLARRKLVQPLEIGRAPSELQSQSHISYAVFCLKKKRIHKYSANTPVDLGHTDQLRHD